MIDAKAFGAELADIVKTATAPLLRRIDQLEKQLADMPAGRDGKDGADGRDGVDGKDGASVTLDDVLPALKDQVADYLAAIPAPQDGKDGVDGLNGFPIEGERRPANLEDVFVLLTGEEIG